MQKQKRPGIDEEDDTAFGGLAPRSGPGRRVPPRRRRGAGKWWLVAIVAAILVLLFLHYITGRL